MTDENDPQAAALEGEMKRAGALMTGVAAQMVAQKVDPTCVATAAIMLAAEIDAMRLSVSNEDAAVAMLERGEVYKNALTAKLTDLLKGQRPAGRPH